MIPDIAEEAQLHPIIDQKEEAPALAEMSETRELLPNTIETTEEPMIKRTEMKEKDPSLKTTTRRKMETLMVKKTVNLWKKMKLGCPETRLLAPIGLIDPRKTSKYF